MVDAEWILSLDVSSRTPKMAQVAVPFSAGMNGLVRILLDFSLSTELFGDAKIKRGTVGSLRPAMLFSSVSKK